MNGQPWETRETATYRDNGEFGGGGGPNSSEGAFNLFPNTYSLAPRSPILTPLYSAPSRGEKVWVQPSLRALIHTNLGKGKENYRFPQFLPSQP